ncbi:MAG: DUF6316 family protein, partial [Gammaproteobacteria bacterium]|nr:DUF6316 family protein [Gammaproteobacteria bacterium]
MRERRKESERESAGRMARTFNIEDLWYFELRGGGQKGPFDSKADMEKALDDYIALQLEVKS